MVGADLLLSLLEFRCQKANVVCLYEISRPSRALFHRENINYSSGFDVQNNKVVAFKGTRNTAHSEFTSLES